MTILEYVQNNYEAALFAFMQSGRHKGPLINTLQRGSSQYNNSKLAEKLESIGFVVPVFGPPPFLEAAQAIEQAIAIKEIQQIQEEVKTEPVRDEVTKKLHQDKVNLLKEASFLHANKLDDDLLPPEELKICSLRVLEIYQKDLPANAATLEYYLKNGTLPQDPENKEEYPELLGVALYRRIETLKKNISRDKGNPARSQHVPKWEAELTIRKQQYAAAEPKTE